MGFQKIAKFGEPTPIGGVYINDFEPWGLNNVGDVAFAADTTGGADAIFLLPRGLLSPVCLAHVGQRAPGGGTLDAGVLGDTAINASGDVAFIFGNKPYHPSWLKGYINTGLYRYSHADRTLRAVVTPGVTAAPGFGRFQSAGGRASLNNFGDIAFPGLIRTQAGISGDFGYGIFVADRNGRFTKVVAPGDPAPGGHKFDYAQNPWINDEGDVAFGAHVVGEECVSTSPATPACGENIYLRKAGTGNIQSIAHTGDLAPGGGRYLWAWGAVMNSRGDIVFMGELKPPAGLDKARGVFLYSAGSTVAIARPGDLMPDGRRIATVNPVFLIGNFYLNNRGDVSFIASLEKGGSGLYVRSGGALRLVAGTGTTIPGVGTVASVTDLVNGGSLNDSGQVFFWARLQDGSGVLLLATP